MFHNALVSVFMRCARHPIVTLVLLTGLSGGSLMLTQGMPFADLYESFFSGDSTEYRYYNDVKKTFVSDQVVAIGLEPPGELFSHDNLAVIREFAKKFEPLASVDDVNDLTTADYFREGTEMFTSAPLVPEVIPTDEAALAAIKKRALGEPLFVGGILSHDGKAAAIHVRLKRDTTFPERKVLVGQIRTLVDEAIAAHPTWRIAVAGDPWLNYFHEVYMARDLATVIPLSGLAMLIVAALVFRRVLGSVFALLGSVSFMTMATAMLPLTGGTMNNCTTMIPVFALIIAMTVIIHFYTELRLNFLRGRNRDEALRLTIEELSLPVAYANLSTALGFFSLAVTPVPAIHQFGIALGLAMIFVVLVPMMFCAAIASLVHPDRLSRVPPDTTESGLVSVRFFTALGNHLFRSRLRWLAAIALISAITLVGTNYIRIETNNITMFHESDRVRKDATYYGDRFGGITTLSVVVEGKGEGALTSPQLLAQMEQVESFLQNEIGAGYVYSPVKYIKTMQRAFFGGDAERYRIPDSQEAAAQLLLINTNDRLSDVLKDDQSKGLILAWINCVSSDKLSVIKQRVNAYLAGLPNANATYRVSGTLMLDMQLLDDITKSTLTSFVLAMGVIFLLRLVQFRSFWFGALSLLPNAFPLWSVFGLMGILDIPLNIATAMSATVILGIADDETIHFFAGYRSSRQRGVPVREAVLETLTEKGSGIFFSTVVIALGFSTLLYSNYSPTMWFGVLLAAALLLSIFANVVFGPVLLDLFKPLQNAEPSKDK